MSERMDRAKALTPEDWLPKTRVRILQTGSLHLRLRNSDERRRILKADEEFWNGLRFPIQRLSYAVPLDLAAHLDTLSGQADADKDPERARMLKDKVDHLRGLIRDRHLIEWLNLVAFPVDESTETERVSYVRSSLERIGLIVTPMTKDGVAAICRELAPADKRFDFGQMDHFRIGQTLCRVLAVRDYPRMVNLAHFLDLYRLDRRVMVVQHVHPTESAALQREVSNSIGEMTGRLAGPLSEYVRAAEETKLQDAQRLLKQLSGENQSVLDFCMYLLVRASSPQELEDLSKRVISRLAGKGMRVLPVEMWQQQDAFRACLPAALNPLRELASRNLLASSIPVTFPYAQVELNHGTGLFHGVNMETGNLVLVDHWRLLKNAHIAFLGQTGSGKSFAMGLLLMQYWSQGVLIRSLDVDGDRNKRRLLASMGAQRLRVAPGAGNYLNPMEVRQQRRTEERDETAEAGNPLQATIQRQLSTFRLMMPDIGPAELAAVEQLLIAVYQAWGITWETDCTSVPRHAWPTWTDLHYYMTQYAETARLASVLSSWVHGSLAGMFDGHTTVNLTNQYVVIDVHEVAQNPQVRGPVFLQVLAYLWDEINQDWTVRKVLDLDEFGILADNHEALQFVWMVTKSARRRSAAVMLATQDPADFLMGLSESARKYAQGILNNCATKVLGFMERKALEQLQQAVRLSEAEVDLLSRLATEEKLILCGEDRAHVEVLASDSEHATLISGKQE